MKKWVKALRSGKYKQGRGVLKHNRENKTFHCCLGVLCEIYNDQMRQNKKKTLSIEIQNGIYHFNKNPADLPTIVKKWAGLETSTADFTENMGRTTLATASLKYISLAEINDDHGYSFKKIANIIEKNWENL